MIIVPSFYVFGLSISFPVQGIRFFIFFGGFMKYTEEERLDIGRQIYDGLLSCSEAAVKFSINPYTARDYMRFYRDLNNLPDKDGNVSLSFARKNDAKDLEFYLSLSKEQLIDELIKAKVNEARAKKGYLVKGGGQKKEFVSLNSKNTK